MRAENEQINILLVDDQPAKLLTYEAMLKELDATLIKATSAQEAFNHLLRNDVAVILIDVFMPDLDGFQLASMVREHPRFERTPIIFISAIYLSEIDRLRGYESGAVDYVPVPVVPEILRAKVKVFVELFRKTRELERLNRELEDRVVERTRALEASNERLRQSEQRLRLASEAAEFGTYEFDLGTQEFHCSSQMKKLIGWESEDELTVEDFLMLIHEGDRGAVRRSLYAIDRTPGNRHRIEFRVMRAGEIRWLLDCGGAFFKGDNEDEPERVMGTVLDLTERKQIEERQLLLMAELDHRVKNILANVGAISQLSSKSSTSVDEFVKALDARIRAIARAHSLLRRDSWDGIDLRTFLDEVLSPFTRGRNIDLDGDDIQLSPKAAQSLALVFHELATNAGKYGALSVPGGRVSISWRRCKPEGVRLVWKELQGPLVSPPERVGFGTTVIRALTSELGAEVSHEFDSDGVVFTLSGPIEQVGKPLASNRCNSTQMPLGLTGIRTDKRFRVLLVEDELLVGLQAKIDLEIAGHKVSGLATNVDQGLDFAEELEFDFALLDIRLGEQLSIPIAERLLVKNIPFIFVTGFEDMSVLPPHLQSIPRLAKPYEVNTILLTMDILLSDAEADNREIYAAGY